MADDIFVQGAYHDHVGDAPLVRGGVHTLSSIEGSDHLHVCAQYPALRVSQHWGIWINELSPPELPVIEVSARSGRRAWTPPGGAYLPGVSLLGARTGVRADDLAAPCLSGTGTGSHETLMTGAPRLPVILSSVRFGARCATNLRIRPFVLSTTMTGGLFGSLDRRLPTLTATGTQHSDSSIALSATLPLLELSSSLAAETLSSLNATLPPLQLSPTAATARTLTLSGLLPVIQVSAAAVGATIYLSGYIPPVVLAPIGTGTQMPDESILESTSRYDNFILRHER